MIVIDMVVHSCFFPVILWTFFCLEIQQPTLSEVQHIYDTTFHKERDLNTRTCLSGQHLSVRSRKLSLFETSHFRSRLHTVCSGMPGVYRPVRPEAADPSCAMKSKEKYSEKERLNQQHSTGGVGPENVDKVESLPIILGCEVE